MNSMPGKVIARHGEAGGYTGNAKNNDENDFVRQPARGQKAEISTSPTRRWPRRSQQRRPNRKAALNGLISE